VITVTPVRAALIAIKAIVGQPTSADLLKIELCSNECRSLSEIRRQDPDKPIEIAFEPLHDVPVLDARASI
jgi:hypothetical protein